MRQGALLACALCCAAPVAAQVSVRVSTGQQTSTQRTLITVKGRVADKEGHSLPGVTVLRKGNMNGVITDIDGRFQINVPKGADAVLQFSFVGMETKEVRVKASALGEKELEIRLDEDAQQLDEVVVTGFVNFKKESFTGNSTTIRKEELQRVSKTNVIKALQAFDPSFRIAENTTWGSDPNALPEVSIRGNSGIGVKELDAQSLTSKSNLQNNPNLPTFIMDGFEIDVTKLYDMDPSRIESITILKDAAATAMYGSRAANGVVVITTVTPKPGKLNVQYSFTGEVEAPDLSDYHLLNAAEKLEAERLAGCYVSDTPADQERLNEEYQGKLYNVRRGVDTYWLSKPLRTVFNHNHSLYIDGGTENPALRRRPQLQAGRRCHEGLGPTDDGRRHVPRLPHQQASGAQLRQLQHDPQSGVTYGSSPTTPPSSPTTCTPTRTATTSRSWRTGTCRAPSPTRSMRQGCTTLTSRRTTSLSTT